jgi:hypothetical protein
LPLDASALLPTATSLALNPLPLPVPLLSFCCLGRVGGRMARL